MNQDLRNAYQWQRQQPGRLVDVPGGYERRPVTAAEALGRARADMAAERKRYPETGGDKLGAPFGDDRLQWIERPGAVGLRFVGFADEIRRCADSAGWFSRADGFGGEVLRGAVYQLPSRNGAPLYVAGYREGSTARAGEFRDTATGQRNRDGPAAIAFGELFRGDESDSDYYPSNRHHGTGALAAARRSDRIAESMAEIQRDYDSAWHAGRRFAECGEFIAATRKRALALLAEMKAERRRGLPEGRAFICATLRERVSDYREAISEARRKRAELKNGDDLNYSWGTLQPDAFNDGADEEIFARA